MSFSLKKKKNCYHENSNDNNNRKFSQHNWRKIHPIEILECQAIINVPIWISHGSDLNTSSTPILPSSNRLQWNAPNTQHVTGKNYGTSSVKLRNPFTLCSTSTWSGLKGSNFSCLIVFEQKTQAMQHVTCLRLG